MWIQRQQYTLERQTQYTHCYIPVAPTPYDLADFSSRSAFVYLAAAIIFMDWVIFWIFFTDFSRFATKNAQE